MKLHLIVPIRKILQLRHSYHVHMHASLLVGADMAQWSHAKRSRSSDRSCTWGMIHTKIHLISPGCPDPGLALQCRMVSWNTIHSFSISSAVAKSQYAVPEKPPHYLRELCARINGFDCARLIILPPRTRRPFHRCNCCLGTSCPNTVLCCHFVP